MRVVIADDNLLVRKGIAALTKSIIFVVITGIITAVLGISIASTGVPATVGYRAVFTDVTGLTVGEQIEALRQIAGEKAVSLIRREPDPTIARIVAGWPRNLDPARALALGFRADASFSSIIKVYIEDELTG